MCPSGMRVAPCAEASLVSERNGRMDTVKQGVLIKSADQHHDLRAECLLTGLEICLSRL